MALEVESAGADRRAPEVEPAPAAPRGVAEHRPVEERIRAEAEVAAIGGCPGDHHLGSELEGNESTQDVGAAADEVHLGPLAEMGEDALEPLPAMRRRAEVAHVDLPHAIEIGERAGAGATGGEPFLLGFAHLIPVLVADRLPEFLDPPLAAVVAGDPRSTRARRGARERAEVEDQRPPIRLGGEGNRGPRPMAELDPANAPPARQLGGGGEKPLVDGGALGEDAAGVEVGHRAQPPAEDPAPHLDERQHAANPFRRMGHEAVHGMPVGLGDHRPPFPEMGDRGLGMGRDVGVPGTAVEIQVDGNRAAAGRGRGHGGPEVNSGRGTGGRRVGLDRPPRHEDVRGSRWKGEERAPGRTLSPPCRQARLRVAAPPRAAAVVPR